MGWHDHYKAARAAKAKAKNAIDGKLPWLSLKDDELSDKLHDFLTIIICSPFFGYLFLQGFQSIATGRLEPIANMFGSEPLVSSLSLTGHAASLGGLALIFLGCCFACLPAIYLRKNENSPARRSMLWAAIFIFACAHFSLASKADKLARLAPSNDSARVR